LRKARIHFGWLRQSINLSLDVLRNCNFAEGDFEVAAGPALVMVHVGREGALSTVGVPIMKGVKL